MSTFIEQKKVPLLIQEYHVSTPLNTYRVSVIIILSYSVGIPESTVAQKLYTSIVTVAIIIALSFIEKLLAQLHNGGL